MVLKSLLLYGSVAGMGSACVRILTVIKACKLLFQTLFGCTAALGAGIFFLATRDVKQGAKMAQRSATQFRQNIKTMREWAEEGAEKCGPVSVPRCVHYRMFTGYFSVVFCSTVLHHTHNYHTCAGCRTKSRILQRRID